LPLEEILGCSDSLDLLKKHETYVRMPLASPEELLVAHNHIARLSLTSGIFEVRQLPTASPTVNVLLLRINDTQRE
jgi:hypothetical protein